jgi:AAHS family 4-hydroxybenzoate transporter-like MFS transporter
MAGRAGSRNGAWHRRHPIAEQQLAGAAAGGPTIAAIIDGKRVGRFQLGIVLLCLLAQMVDGFDNQASAFVAPALAGQWHVAREALGPVFGAGAFGTMVGCLLIGPVGDLLGRKAVVALSLALTAVLMAATSAVTSLDQLILVRFLTGLPLGALIPGTVVVANEWSPSRSRAPMVTIMACGFALGALLGGQLSSLLLPRFGWASVFHAGALGTALICGAVLLWMPESPRFLSLRPSEANRARIAKILRRFDPAGTYAFDTAEPPARGFALVTNLFSGGRGPVTLLLWAAFFMNALVLNFMTFWLPTLLAGTGLPIAVAIRTSTLFQLGGLGGVVLMGAFANRVGSWRLVVAGYLFSAAAVALVGTLAGSERNAAIAVAGFCVIGVQMSMAALTATLYPTAIRSTGTSWAMGVGRFGSTIGPLLGGVLIGWHWELPRLFGAIALASACGFALVLLLARRAKAAE